MSSDSATEGKLYDRGLTLRLLKYTRPYLGFMVFGLGALILLSVASNSIPLLMKLAIDNFIAGKQDGLALAERLNGVYRIAGFMAGIGLFTFILRALHLYIMRVMGERVIRDLRRDCFAKILALPLQYFDRTPVGRLMTRVTSDMDALQRFVAQGVVGLVANLLLLVGVIVFTLVINWRMALLLYTVMPLVLITLTFINSRDRVAHRTVRSRQSSLNAYLEESISGVSTIQHFTREDATRKQFEEKNFSLLQGSRESTLWYSLYFPNMELMNGIALALILVSGGWGVIAGTTQVGTLVAFIIYIREIFRPMEDLSEKSNVFQAAMASAERIFALLDEPEIIEDPENPEPLETFHGAVEFDRVTFRYPGSEPVLRNVSFRVAPGESIALVGATGAGKTTITSLLARFYEVEEGQIKVDGRDVRDYAQADLRRRIGIVLQDPFIFSDTILENIRMHQPEVTREQAMEAAQHVNAHTFIQHLPQGYDTVLGERGSNLSTGQKQLLAMARCLVQNPDIVLVLDEATANVDTETEQLIQSALHRLMKERTTIVIAHRLSTIKDVDRILVMRKGNIIEEGSHLELLRQAGYYRTLYELLSHAPA